jgi:hypothetical protein
MWVFSREIKTIHEELLSRNEDHEEIIVSKRGNEVSLIGN